MSNVTDQLRRHSVALISLVVALSSLGYNTWRNERTEANRNVRTAGVSLLLALSELDRVVFYSHYDEDPVQGNPRTGWALVLTIRDLGRLTREPAITSTAGLVDIWAGNWTGLGKEKAKADRISDAIETVRSDMLGVLESLD